MDHPDHPAMIQTGAIGLCAARECVSQEGALADRLEELGISLSRVGDGTHCKAFVLLVSTEKSYEKVRPAVVSALVQRACIILVKMAPGEIPEEARDALRDAVVIDAVSSVEELTAEIVAALQRCGAVMKKPTAPVRPLP